MFFHTQSYSMCIDAPPIPHSMPPLPPFASRLNVEQAGQRFPSEPAGAERRASPSRWATSNWSSFGRRLL